MRREVYTIKSDILVFFYQSILVIDSIKPGDLIQLGRNYAKKSLSTVGTTTEPPGSSSVEECTESK